MGGRVHPHGIERVVAPTDRRGEYVRPRVWSGEKSCIRESVVENLAVDEEEVCGLYTHAEGSEAFGNISRLPLEGR